MLHFLTDSLHWLTGGTDVYFVPHCYFLIIHSSPHIWYSCYQTLLHIISTYWSYRVEISIPNSLRALTQKIDFGTQVEVVIIYFRKASNCLFIKSTKTHIVFRIWCSFSNYWHVFWIFMDIFWGVLKLYFFTKEVIILIC